MARIYTDGTRDPSLLSHLSWMLAGVAVGATLMYLFDPHSGNRRRALVRDKTLSAGRKARKMAEAQSRHLGNKAQGWRNKASQWMDTAATELERAGRQSGQRHGMQGQDHLRHDTQRYDTQRQGTQGYDAQRQGSQGYDAQRQGMQGHDTQRRETGSPLH